MVISLKVRFTVQVKDKAKRLSKQQAADLVDQEHDNDIRKSVKRSNLVRQQEFKKMKKNQKRTGTTTMTCVSLNEPFRSLEKSVANLGDALDSMVRLTTEKNPASDSYNFQTDFN